MATHPITFLWTTPRSRSTAFERMMIERGDHTVLDEPFSERYYFSSERMSDRYPDKETSSTAEAVLDRIYTAAAERPVFVKDMAYHVGDLIEPGFLAGFTNTFLVREPTAALSSLERMWPDFTDEEAGYEALGHAFDLSGGAVLESDDLATDPPGLIRAWCEAVGIDFDPDALTWEPGMVAEWVHWREWYEGVAQSSGFVAPTAAGADSGPPSARLSELLPVARSAHERMVAGKLTAPR
ncbi:MAG: sulfotransferase family protein [Microthrixaceae bacterium]